MTAFPRVAPGLSIRRSGHPVTLPVAGLSGLAAFTSLYWAFMVMLGAEPSIRSGFLWLLGFSLLAAWCVQADRCRPRYSAPFEFSAFVFFGWPLLLPWYLFRTRGRRGLLWAAAAFAVFLAPFLTALAAYTLLAALQ